MKKTIIGALILICSILNAEDQRVFNFTFVPGVNLFREDSRTVLATGLLSSNVHSVTGVQFGPLFSTTKEGVEGVQGSGLFNISGDDVSGVQYSGLFNIADGSFHGAQGGGIFNIANGNFNGVQCAGIFNVNRGTTFTGFQGAGILNVSNNSRGLQAAGLINISGKVRGVQAGGLFNYADNIDGVQIGLVNIAANNTNGAVPIGVLNLYKNGIKDISAWVDSNRYLYQGIETGGKHVYTLIFTGTKIEDFRKLDSRIFGCGIGYRFYPFFGNIDIVAASKYVYDSEDWKNEDNWTPELRASLSIKLGPLAVFGGAAGNIFIDGYNDEGKFHAASKSLKVFEKVRASGSLFAGVKVQL